MIPVKSDISYTFILNTGLATTHPSLEAHSHLMLFGYPFNDLERQSC